MIATHALAQTPAPVSASPSAAATASGSQADPAQTVEEVTVTATRAGGGFSAPTPTNVIGADTLQAIQSTNVAAALDEIPSFKASNSPDSAGLRSNAPGVNQADLRGLGANRTLVLVDGSRVVPNVPTNVVGSVAIAPDLNVVPEIMVDRIDVVTGGASAQWGSDAMAGVVNIVLKHHYEGFEATAQGGLSQYGDDRQMRFGALAGHDFLDGKLHAVAAVEYTDSGMIGNIETRPWGREDYEEISNPNYATNGAPAILIASGVHGYTAPGGLIAGPANFSLKNDQILPGGALAPFNPGAFNNGTFQIGGSGQPFNAETPQSPEVKRFIASTHFEYNLNNHVNLFVEASYADVQSDILLNPFRDSSTVIKSSNPYLPAQISAAMTAANITSFTLDRINYDIGGLNEAFSSNKTPRVLVGGNGEINDSWKWDAHLSFSENTNGLVTPHDKIASNYSFAEDPVLYNGQVVCRATVPGASYNAAAAGCVPINLFGAGAPSAAAVGYVTGTSNETSVYQQTAAAANVSGTPFRTWAGPVHVGMGVEYRLESQKVTADPLSLANQFQFGNTSAFKGSFDVAEGYFEVNAPLARDLTFMKSLDFNGAVRQASYSTSGASTTWKVGGVYEPVSGLRLRVTRSHDLRAPALYELYSAGGVQNLNLVVNGKSVNIPANVNIGNPELKPETGDTITGGFVVEPPSISGLSVSVDYYDIKITNAITTVLPTTIASLCSAGQQQFCNAFTFNASGVPTALNFSTLNAASLENEGVDFVAHYRFPLSRISSVLPGSLSLTADATYVEHVYVNVGFGSATIDRAGENSSYNNYALPHLRAHFLGTYSVGPADLSAEINFISRGHLDNTWNTAPSNTVNDNNVPNIAYTNLYASYKLLGADRLRLFGSISNVFNQAPPPIPNPAVFTITNGEYYDLVGRAFTVGVTAKF